MFLFVNECFLFTKNVSILKHNNALNVVCSKGEGCKNSESDSYLFPCQGNSQEEVQLAAEIFSFRPAGGIFILLTLSLTSTLFKTHTISLDPFLQKGSSLQVENLSVCLSVCHHFKISNIGPLYHPRITPDPTYYILMGRG